MKKEIKIESKENGLKAIDVAIEKIITIKIYMFMLIGMMLYSIIITNYTMIFSSIVLFYLIVKIKNKYRAELVDDKEYKKYLQLKKKYEDS